MDLLKPIVRYVTQPLYVRRDGYNYERWRRKLNRSQWLTAEELVGMQSRRLRDLLEFCYRQSPFHRARMDAIGLVPSDVRTAEDLSALPLLSKDDMRTAGSRLFSRGYSVENTIHTRTGGSTGVPLHVYVDRDALDWKYAATWRHNGWAGWRPGDKVAAIWGDTDRPFELKSWLRYCFYHRTVFLDTLKFSPERLRRFHARMLEYKPTILFGHAHSVYQFALFCAERDLQPPKLMSIVTTAMTLSQLERRIIQEVFRAPVFNRYGCEELSIIASESEAHSGLHVFSEGLILEYLPTEVADEHELVITDLWNRAMPMVRYAIGDVVRKASGACPSGRGLERLERVSGRTADFLYRPDGTPVFGISLLDTYVIHIPGIKQAQLVQEDLHRIEVYIVPTQQFGRETEAAIRRMIEAEFGPSVVVHLTCVTQLQQTARGKYRFSICKITRPGSECATTTSA